MKHRSAQSGVTLLETMLALAVMSLIAVAVASSMSATARVISKTQEVGHQVDFALARLELRVFAEAAVSGSFPGDDPELAGLAGGSDRISFQAVIDDGVFWPGAPVYFEVAPDDDGRIVARASGVEADGEGVVVTQRALSGPAAVLHPSYFGLAGGQDLPGWHAQWSRRDALPLLVKMSVTDAERSYPVLVVRPGKTWLQSEMSLSSLVPPALPSRP